MLLQGKKALILGLANNKSIAYGIASCFKEQGARLAFNYVGDAIKKRVEPLSEELGGEFTFQCDVSDDAQIAAAAELVKEKWGEVDILVHSIAFANREDLTGRFVDTTREGFHLALDISACEAVKATESYGTPPYSMPIDVYLSFWTGTPRAKSAPAAPQTPAAPTAPSAPAASPALTTPPENTTAHQGITPSPASVPATSSGIAQDAYGPQFKRYFSNVVWKLRNAIFIPVESKPGTYRVTVRLDVDTAGNIKHYDIVSGSGDERLDKYVRQGIKRAGSIPPPPAGLGSTMDVTLTLTR